MDTNAEKAPTAPDNVPGVQSKLKDITGQKFGRLTVVRRAGKNICGHATWYCQCDCKNPELSVVAGSALRGKKVVSCGCYHSEVFHNKKHGMSQHPIYDSHYQMMRRCYNPDHVGWEDYGGRKEGHPITVCERWHIFENFLEDMQATWAPDLTIDRRDVNGNYCPENCYWATMTEQNNNKRNNRRIEHNGQTMTAAQWARSVGLSLQTFLQRLDRGWTMGENLSTPADQKHAPKKKSYSK